MNRQCSQYKLFVGHDTSLSHRIRARGSHHLQCCCVEAIAKASKSGTAGDDFSLLQSGAADVNR